MNLDLGRVGRFSARLLVNTALVSTIAFASAAHAQQQDTETSAAANAPGAPAPSAVPAPAAPQDAAQAPDAEGGLGEIVVTAQRREQRLQDVPIAITALTQDALQTNRVQSVLDLSGQAPNLTVRQSAGSIGIPSFTIRGITSYGVVPGSDKEVSIYVDGVYIGSPRGSSFDLPDISRIEVLRGPQGTLFGRNATAGAISISTREPTGEFGFRQEVSIGNYDQRRTRTSIDLPSVGPFSAYGTFLYNRRRGDIRNAGAGTRWDRTGPLNGEGIKISPKYLGSHNVNSFFGALKFEPSDNFKTTYKFDRSTDNFTPDGVAAIAVNPGALPAVAPLLTAAVAASPNAILVPDAKRPDVVNNSWSTPGYSRVYGHNLTSDLSLGDHLAVKNIAAYRKSYIEANTQLDGLGGLIYPFPPIAGAPFLVTVGQNQAQERQFSDELQFNYNSDLLTLTVGGLYFWQKGRSGSPLDMRNTPAFQIYPGGRVALGAVSYSRNKGKSIAAYSQAEVHVTPQLDLVGGFRITRDKKSGAYVSGGTFVNGPNGVADGTIVNPIVSPFTYKKSKPSFSAGVNYKPNSDILLFAKYSTAFVSGGSVGGVPFDPETAKSWEGGIKADLLGRKLRTNLALFYVDYDKIQSAQSGINFGRPDLGTIVVPLGDGRAKGFEAEITAMPVHGLTLTSTLGYTDINYRNINPIVTSSVNGVYLPTLSPKWTSNLSAQYETQPLFGDTRLMLRADGIYRSKMRSQQPGQIVQSPSFAGLEFIESAWLINARAALQKIQIGPVTGEVALWARNLNNNRAPAFPLNFGGYALSSTFQAARTYGADFIVTF